MVTDSSLIIAFFTTVRTLLFFGMQKVERAIIMLCDIAWSMALTIAVSGQHRTQEKTLNSITISSRAAERAGSGRGTITIRSATAFSRAIPTPPALVMTQRAEKSLALLTSCKWRTCRRQAQ